VVDQPARPVSRVRIRKGFAKDPQAVAQFLPLAGAEAIGDQGAQMGW
jgi:hypothetical protein